MVGRSPLRWVPTAFFVVVGLVVVWLLLAADPPRVDREPSEGLASRDSPRPIRVDPAGPLRTPTPSEAGQGQAPVFEWSEDHVVAEVRDADNGSPIPGARLRVLALAAGAARPDVLLESDVQSDATTDERGRCGLDRLLLSRAHVLLLSAQDYRTTLASSPAPPPAGFVVEMARGWTITGEVRDRLGNPLAGVEVVCAHEGWPRGGEGAGVLAMEGRDRARCRTDEEGVFQLTGLSPGGYDVRVHAEGWILDQDLPTTGLRMPRVVDRVHAKAGDAALDLVMVPVRLYHLSLLRGDTGVAVSSTLVGVDVRAEGTALPTDWKSFSATTLDVPVGTDGKTIPTAPGMEAGHVVGHVVLDSQAVPEHGVAHVEADGYRPIEARVRLRTPEAFVRDSTPDLVRLDPLLATDVGLLRVRCDRPLPTIWRPPLRLLSGCRHVDGHRFHLRGSRVDGDLWAFSGVPAGESAIRVFDGVSFSTALDVTVPAGGASDCRASFPPPEGIVFQLRDADGRTVFDADLTLVCAPGDHRAVANLRALTRLHLGPDGALDVVHPLAPGTYQFAIGKNGYGQGAGTFTVRAGGITRQVVTLSRPPRRP